MKSLEIVDKLLEKINQYDDWFITEMEAQKIKQDLEVLEILRKHLSIIGISTNWIEIDLYEKEQKEDFNKVKQWLEENENE